MNLIFSLISWAVFGLVIGSIQAYIFSVLATVYIAAATSTNNAPAAPATDKGGS